jgi:hypothetical protein
MQRLLITLLLSSLVCWVSPAAASERGYVIQNGARLSIEGQKSIWSASRRRVTVYLLGCPYRDALLENWTQRSEFLYCYEFPARDTDELAAKLFFHISEAGALERLELRTRSVGRDVYRGGLKHVWKENFPVRNLSVNDDNELVFNAAIDLPDKGLMAVIE